MAEQPLDAQSMGLQGRRDRKLLCLHSLMLARCEQQRRLLLLTSIGCLQLFGAHGTSIVDLEPREAQWMDYIELFVLYVCILP